MLCLISAVFGIGRNLFKATRILTYGSKNRIKLYLHYNKKGNRLAVPLVLTFNFLITFG